MLESTKNLKVLILLHILTIVVSAAVLTFLIPPQGYSGTGHFLLEDDGYYRISEEFVGGGSLFYRGRGFGLALIYSAIHFFPNSLHPYVRLILSLTFNIFTLVILRLIASRYITDREFFLGGVLLIFNPAFVHFTIKSVPDNYLAFFVTCFAYFFLKSYYSDSVVLCFVIASLVLVFSIFIRPSVLLIPPVLMLIGIVNRNRKLFILAFILLMICMSAFMAFRTVTDLKGEDNKAGYTTGVHDFIWDTYLIENILRSGKIEKGTYLPAHSVESNQHDAIRRYRAWRDAYSMKNPDSGSYRVLLDFIRENPVSVTIKFCVNPIFVFTLGSRTIEFYINLVFTALLMGFLVIGIRHMERDLGVWIILGIGGGYLLTFVIIHVAARYSVGIIALLSIFAGKGFQTVLRKIGNK